MTKRHYTSHKKPHYYINPITGRVIKSNSKMFEKLKKRRFIVQKDACLYDLNSAKKCLSSIIDRYSGLVYPSSNFMNIPSTYHKRFKAKGFIKNTQRTHINGFIDKKGKFKKLKPEILLPSHNITEVISLKHHHLILHNKVDTSDNATTQEHNEIKEQIDHPPRNNLTMLFNPIQNDIIPVDNSIPKENHTEIINKVNKDLIPNELPIVKETTVAGLIMDILNPMKILGFTNSENDTKKFKRPIVIQTSKYKTPQHFNNENEQNNYNIPSVLNKDYQTSIYSLPSKLISKVEEIPKEVITNRYSIPSYINHDIEQLEYSLPSKLISKVEEIPKEVITNRYSIPSYINHDIEQLEYSLPSELISKVEEIPKEVITNRYAIPSILNKEYNFSKYDLPSELISEAEELPKEVITNRYAIPSILNKEYNFSKYDLPSELISEAEELPKEVITNRYAIPSILNKEYNFSKYDLPSELIGKVEEIPKEVITNRYAIPSILNKEYNFSKYDLPSELISEAEELPKEVITNRYNISSYINHDIEQSEYILPLILNKEYQISDYIVPEHIDILNQIPQVQISQDEISKLPIADKNDEEEFKENLAKICGDNEQLNQDGNCNSCEYYHLAWDPEVKKCKKIENLTLVLDNQNNIKGYMDHIDYPYVGL